MRGSLVVAGFVVSTLLICASAPGRDTRWLMHGTVTWGAKTPAASVKLRLLQKAEEKAVEYTNQEGRYALFDVPGRPSDYTLEVWFGEKLLKTYTPKDLQRILRGGRFDIQVKR